MTSVITLCADSRIRHQGRYLIQSTHLSSTLQVRYSNVLELAIVNFLCMQLNDAYILLMVMHNMSHTSHSAYMCLCVDNHNSISNIITGLSKCGISRYNRNVSVNRRR